MPETTRTSQKPTKKVTRKGSETSNETQELPVDISSVKQEITDEEDDVIDLTFIDLRESDPTKRSVQPMKKKLVAGIKKSKDSKSQKKLRTKGTAAESVLRIVRNSRAAHKKKLENMTQTPGTLHVPERKKKKQRAGIPNEVNEPSEKVLQESITDPEITEIPSIKLGHSSKKRMSEKKICVPQKEMECIEQKLENMTKTSGTLLVQGRKKKRKRASIPNEVTEPSEKVLEENSTEHKITEIPNIKLGHSSKKKLPEKNMCVPQNEIECVEVLEEILPDTQSKSQEPASKIPKTPETSLDILPEMLEIKEENICEDDNIDLAIIEMDSITRSSVLENKRKLAARKYSLIIDVGNAETQGVQAPRRKKQKVSRSQLPKTCIFDARDYRTIKVKASIIPIKKKVGIIGFGPIARGIANCFQRTGHKVIVWSRNPEKLKKYTYKITLAESPAALIEKCDLIFSCVANVDAVKEVMKGQNGILEGLEGNATSKGYIEMTSIDPETSCLFAEEISGKGGLFLEAQLQGTRISAHIGSLVVLASGDRKLFEDCESCFTAIAKHVHFLNAEVGMASKANIILNSIEGTSFGCLAEIMTLLDNTDVDVNLFVEMLRFGYLDCPKVVSRTQGMANKPKAVFIPARHMHNNMRMTLDMGHTLSQPTPMAASASQFFKEVVHRTVRDRDVAPLYCRRKKPVTGTN